jgi:hypothetical protein
VISTSDKIRIVLAPLFVVLGIALCADFVRGPHTPMVAVMGLLFVAYGVYKLRLIARGLRNRQ